MKSLYERLTEYGESDYYGFHMPGHKRNEKRMGNQLPYKIDITEIEGFDDLHHAREILKDAQERAAKVYHAEETHYLINGSTSGLLSAILGCTHKGGRILMARNCHKSVYAAVYMNELEPVYIYPEYDAEDGLNGEIDAGKLLEILKADENVRQSEATLKIEQSESEAVSKTKQIESETVKLPDEFREQTPIQAVVITSPTYDGVVSDVRLIAEVTHEFGIPLIVDEAHGAHFGFHPYFPENANQQGADVVIHSLHKTLPSLTQTALLHMNGNLVNRARIRKYAHMLQTSSPSYVLMASMDECIRFLEKDKTIHGQFDEETGRQSTDEASTVEGGREKIKKYAERLKWLREELRKLKYLRLVETENYDKSKIVISTSGTEYTGKMLYEELLEKYHLQMEMASREYVLAMTSVCDTEEGFERLKEALFEIDKQLEENSRCEGSGEDLARSETDRAENEVYCTSAQADILAEKEEDVISLSIKESAGKVALEYAYVYPPGIPMIVPGEWISEETVHLLEKYASAGFDIEGLEQEGRIKVLADMYMIDG